MKCFECGNATRNNYSFCKTCFNKLKDDESIVECDICGDWHYADKLCLCEVPFTQCKKCGRWHDENDDCICSLTTIKDKNIIYQKKTKALSEAELLFLNKLEKAIDLKKYMINLQTSLRQLVEKTKKWCWANELNRDIDFCVLRKDTCEVILCIEYDDSTHELPKRIERDNKVNSIADDAGLKLIHINKRDDNISVDYLKGKLENYL